MIDIKCKNCPELIIPYWGIYAKPNPKLPEELKVGTCKCNVDFVNRQGEGYYGWCHPDECKGPGHRYYFDYSRPNTVIKFID